VTGVSAADAAQADLGVCQVGAAIDRREPSKELAAAEGADDDQVEGTVSGIRGRRDLHAAAVPGAVGHDHGGERHRLFGPAVDRQRRRHRPVRDESFDDRAQVGQRSKAAARGGAPGHRGVEPCASGADEVAARAVGPLGGPEIERCVRALAEPAGGQTPVGGEAEVTARVAAAAREDRTGRRQRRAARVRHTVDDLVQGAVAADRHHERPARAGRAPSELGGVTAACGPGALEREPGAIELAGDRRPRARGPATAGRGIDDDERARHRSIGKVSPAQASNRDGCSAVDARRRPTARALAPFGAFGFAGCGRGSFHPF